MTQFLRYSNRLLSQFSRNNRKLLTQSKCNYSSKSNKTDEIIVSNKKKYIYVGCVLASMAGFAYYTKREQEYALMRQREKAIKQTGIGGKWTLTDPKGEERSSEDFRGKWCMIYFGFTHCPDICPDEMEKLTAVTKQLDKEGIDVQPIFITIDPERDSKEVVGKYVKEFSDKIIGLTGTKDQIKNVCHAFNVYFKKGIPDATNDYIVDHTIILYLIDPNGAFIDYWGMSKTSDEIIHSVKVNMNKWTKLRDNKNWLQRLFG